jgi:hypothetical protein
LIIAAASFFLKSIIEDTSLSLCGENVTEVNGTQSCDVIFPVMYVSYIIIGVFIFLALLYYFTLRCIEDFCSDGTNYENSKLVCVKKNNIDLFVIVATVFFWIILTAPVYVKCVLTDLITSCFLEIVFRVGCWLISNVGSVGILTLWVLFVFGEAKSLMKSIKLGKNHISELEFGAEDPTDLADSKEQELEVRIEDVEESKHLESTLEMQETI